MEHLQTVENVFSDKLLKVPDYQRGYAWDIKQCNDLVEDLDLIENNQDHYTGTLVIHKSDDGYLVRDEEGSTLHTYDIVDGQQRLTTIVILLNELARELNTIQNKEKLADGIRKKYITIADSENMPRSRLTLNDDSDSFFKSSIISNASVDGPRIKSHTRLKVAKEYFSEYLAAMKDNFNENEYAEWLTQLHNKITGNLVLTVYEVPRATDVGIIFEVMNNRGKPLSEMDKVKNYLLYLSSKIELNNASSDLGNKINKIWAEIFKTLMESSDANIESENQLLRSHWLMAYDSTPKNWKGYDSVKAKFKLKDYKGRGHDLYDAIDEYIESLMAACTVYCDIISPSRSNSFLKLDDGILKSNLREHTQKLLRTGSLASFYPLLISIRLKHTDNFELYLKYLKVAEQYAFRVYRFAKRNSNAGQAALYKYGHELYHGKDAEQYIPKIRNLLLYHAPDNEFALKLELGNMDWYHWVGIKYLLYEYEGDLSNGVPMKISWEDVRKKKDTIEHILPQTSDNDYWTKIWDVESIETHLHDIGNLCITFDNSHYSNKSFPDKKGSTGNGYCYANSSLFMERNLDKFNDWTKAECMIRRNEIIQWAKKRWHIEPVHESTFTLETDDDENE